MTYTKTDLEQARANIEASEAIVWMEKCELERVKERVKKAEEVLWSFERDEVMIKKSLELK